MAKQATVKEAHAMLEQYLRDRSDMGAWNAVATWVMEAKNPFESESIRKPQPWFVFFSAASLAAIRAFVYCNLWN